VAALASAPPSLKAALPSTIVHRAQIHPSGNIRCSPFASTGRAKDRHRQALPAKGRAPQVRRYGLTQFAQRVHAIAAHEGRMFARAKERVVVEQENPVLGTIDDRLNQHESYMSRPRRDSG